MYGISKFLPRKLKICPNYNHSLPAVNSFKNKILIHGAGIQNIANNRRSSTYSFHGIKLSSPTFRNSSTLSMEGFQTQRKKKSRKWTYLLGLGGLLGGSFFYYTSEDDDEYTTSGLTVPSKPSDITKDWIESMLSEYENRKSEGANVIAKSFEVSNALQPGEGLNSQLLKLDVYASVQNQLVSGTVSYDKEYHLMIKMPDRSKAMILAMNKYIGSDLKELTLYSKVIPELNKFQEMHGNEFRIKVPGLLYEKYTSKDSVLIMENGKHTGYIPHSSKKETDLIHAKVLVENLAKLHAVSYSYNKNQNFLDKFPCYKEDGIMNNNLCHFYTDGILDNLIKLLLLTNDSYSNELAVKIRNNKELLDEKIKNVMRDNDSKKMMCLTHADCHNSNLLFKYGESKDGNQKIEDFQFIDWQFSHWNSPIIDLQYFSNICMSHEFRKAHLESLLEHYHCVFTHATTRMGTPASHWTYEEFRKEYERFSGFSLIKSAFSTQVILSKLFETYQSGARKESSHSYPRIEKINAKLFKNFWNQMFTNPAFEKIIFATLQALLLYLIGIEITNETNPILNDRIFGLILDADEQGLFDNYNEAKTQTQTQISLSQNQYENYTGILPKRELDNVI